MKYALISGDDCISIKNGKVVVKKGTPVGTYSATARVTADGNTNYKAAKITVAFKVRVKP